ncbi:MAG: E3 binding domain-containing protein [Solirubrobacterales bacterium]
MAEPVEGVERAGTVDVTMPENGTEDGTTLVSWLVQPGEVVETDAPICLVGWNGSAAELASPATGIVRMLAVAPGTTVPAGTSLALIDTRLPAPVPVPEPEPEREPEPQPQPEPEPEAEPEPEPEKPVLELETEPEEPVLRPEPEPVEVAPVAEDDPGGEPVPVELVRDAPIAEPPPLDLAGFVSPAVRRLAERHRVDLDEVAGTGLGGRVTLLDLRRHVASRTSVDRA